MNIGWEKVVEYTRVAKDIQMEYWLNETLFHFSWWVLFCTTLTSLIVWLIIVDKKRIFEIITYGFAVGIIGAISDRMGVFLKIWEYKHTLTPLSSTIEIHIVLMPVIYMIIYQYFNTWKNFFIATTINAFVFAFILEPLLVWLQIYELDKWKHFYSFLPYILIAVMCKYVINKLKQNDK